MSKDRRSPGLAALLPLEEVREGVAPGDEAPEDGSVYRLHGRQRDDRHQDVGAPLKQPIALQTKSFRKKTDAADLSAVRMRGGWDRAEGPL